MQKTLYRTLIIISIAALIAMIGRSQDEYKTEEKIDQSPSTMQAKPYPMLLDTTDKIVAYDITDCHLDLACGKMPSRQQENVIFCAAAAFTGKCMTQFEHTNILGQHISNGVLYEGYTEDKDGIPYAQRYALFVWKGVDEQGNMLEKGFFNLPNDSLLQQAAADGGMAFTQHWVIKDTNIFEPTIRPFERVEYFRAICQKYGRYYIIANRIEMSFHSFLDTLIAYGVENALYMDMGTGWNHSFYRDENNQLHILHPRVHQYPTNWIVVYK